MFKIIIMSLQTKNSPEFSSEESNYSVTFPADNGEGIPLYAGSADL